MTRHKTDDGVLVTIANQDASTMRARAQLLRALAVELERTPAMALEQFAGADTWRSPRADECHSELVADQTRIHHAADELRWTALRLERCATDVEGELARLRALEAS
jgi:hypothetical protein